MSNKIVITGHTSGIGKAIFDKFTEVSCHEIIGMSRSNGYDIEKDFDKVVEEATGADFFVNNAYRDSQQLKLFHALKDKVNMMVVMGSVSRHYPELIPTDYVRDKQALAEACRLESINPNGIPILHLDLSFIQGTEIHNDDPTAFLSDYNTPLEDIVDTIMFWAQKPTIRQIEFRWKLTDQVKSEFQRINTVYNDGNIKWNES
jgi:nucleoside-diphosphate-sugar epimerase|tara:strand:- start:878 stop:1486 length:609 start_codon:yes stop_codon:yes gene_type:complete